MENKGTIIYIGDFELPDKNAAAHRVLSNGKIFRDLGYKVVFVGIDKALEVNSNIINTKKDIYGFDTWSISYPKKLSEWPKHLSDIGGFEAIFGKYKDVRLVVAYNYQAFALNKLKRHCENNNCKIIADCTEWYGTKGSNLLFKIIKGFDSSYRMRIIHKQLDGLIVISKYLEDYYRNCNNVVRIPPLIDTKEDKWVTTYRTIDVKDGPNTKWKFVYSGRPGKNKDKLNYIIDAFYELRDFGNYSIDIIGIDIVQFTKYYPECTEKIKVLNGKIRFIGRTSHIESLARLKHADYSIFIREKSRLTMAGFPTKFVESITCGTPVITTDTSDIKEYFTDKSFGFLLNRISIEQLLRVLRKILETDNCINENKLIVNKEIFYYKKYKGLFEEMLAKILV